MQKLWLKKIIKNRYIEIQVNNILSIKERKTDLDRIDIKGAWLMPGFIDGYVHGGYENKV